MLLDWTYSRWTYSNATDKSDKTHNTSKKTEESLSSSSSNPVFRLQSSLAFQVSTLQHEYQLIFSLELQLLWSALPSGFTISRDLQASIWSSQSLQTSIIFKESSSSRPQLLSSMAPMLQQTRFSQQDEWGMLQYSLTSKGCHWGFNHQRERLSQSSTSEGKVTNPSKGERWIPLRDSVS